MEGKFSIQQELSSFYFSHLLLFIFKTPFLDVVFEEKWKRAIRLV